MTAFGPYKEHTVLDFTDFGHQNIFLVSGPTGAGKTTIFDAIAYALYDDASGNSRDKNTFKSDYASDDVFCEVIFSFEINGKEYRVERSPAQDGPGKRGVRSHLSKVSFFHDGQVTTKIKDANEEIEELLGLTYAQFKQIVMLPQGEFKKLLESNSKDKEEIFRNIFRTETILAFQEELKTQAASLKKSAEAARSTLNGAFNYLIDIVDESIMEAKDQEDFEEVLTRLSVMEETFNEQRKTLEINNTAIQTDIKQVEEQLIDLKKLDDLQQSKLDLEDKQAQFSTIEQQIQAFENAKACIEAKENWKKEENDLYLLVKQQAKDSKTFTDTSEELKNKKEAFKSLADDYAALGSWREKEKMLVAQVEQFLQMHTKQSQQKSAESNKESNRSALLSLKTDLENIQADLKIVNSKMEAILETQKELANKKELVSKIDATIKDLERKEKEFEALNKLITKKAEAVITFQDAQKHYINQSDYLTAQRNLFNQNLAGVLASELVSGEACLVCGSTEHPNPAHNTDDAPTEEAIELYQAEADEAQIAFSDSSANVASLNDQIRAVESQLGFSANELPQQQEDLKISLLKKNEDLTNLRLLIESLQKEVNQEAALLKKQKELLEAERSIELAQKENQTNLKNIEESLKTLSTEIAALEEDLKDLEFEQLEHELKALTAKIQVTEKDYPLAKGQIDELDKSLAVQKNTLESLEIQIINMTKRVSNQEILYQTRLREANLSEDFEDDLLSKDEIERHKKALKTYQDAVTVNINNLATQAKIVAKYGDDVLEESVIEKISELNEAQQIIEKNLSILNNDIQTIKKGRSEITNIYEKMRELLTRFQKIQYLSQIANGTSKETGRMSFERYVLAIYYEEIVSAANIRLQQMTDDRYLLIRTEEVGKGAGAKGLELDVFDHYTGQKRSVKTLSGGESFKASLALALGLSGVMQQQSGGTQIDTLFIDEGFGTLDSESLDNAIHTLMEINACGRMIGVISHVEELKTRIPAHIKVTHSPEGSQAKIIV